MLEAILGYEPSYGELAIADELVSEEQVEEEYGGVYFTPDDFFLLNELTYSSAA